MNDQERAPAERLQIELRRFWDQSIVDPIQRGDNLHNAISEYRDSLPCQHLPAGEGKLMRRTIYGSRSEEKVKRDDAQLAAEEWDELLTAKYSSKPAEDKSDTKRRRRIDWWLEKLTEYESEWEDDSALTETAFAHKIGEKPNTLIRMFKRARQEIERRENLRQDLRR